MNVKKIMGFFMKGFHAGPHNFFNENFLLHTCIFHEFRVRKWLAASGENKRILLRLMGVRKLKLESWKDR